MAREDAASTPASGMDRDSGWRACARNGDPVDTDSCGSTSERSLLERARRGSHTAVAALFERYRPWLRRWARGRLPRRARGAVDTSDLVQETLQRTFTHLTSFKSCQTKALRVYLRRAVENRIRDELRRATFRQGIILPEGAVRDSDDSPQLGQLIDDETWRRLSGDD